MNKRRIRGAYVAALALVLVGLNALKPLVIDDGLFEQYARQIAVHPADPYGFDILWFDAPRRASEMLAPPVLPYWLGAAIALFGEHPVAWKLWMLPFAYVLCFSLARLSDRVSTRHAPWLLALITLSPAVLPALNLMSDLPALALSLCALCWLLDEADGPVRSGRLIAAGLLGGLAMETKYTAVLPVATGILYLQIVRGGGRAVFAGAISAGVFLGWELFVALRYGASHFVSAMALVDTLPHGSLAQWLVSLLCLLGVAAPAAGLVMLAALRVSPWLLGAIGSAVIGLWLAVALIPGAPVGSLGALFPDLSRLSRLDMLFAGIGLLVAAATLALAIAGPARPVARSLRGRGWRERLAEPERRLDLLLSVWLLLELIGSFALPPFPAMRRLIGPWVVMCLMAVRAAEHARVSPRTVRLVTLFGVTLGLVFALSELGDARARWRAVERLRAELDMRRTTADAETVWFVGQWGFRYYATQAGMVPLIPGSSAPRAGDWIATARGVFRQRLAPFGSAVEPVTRIAEAGVSPWSPLPGAYGGHRPLRPQPVSQIEIRLDRVRRDFAAQGRP